MATLSSFWILFMKVLIFLELSTWYLIPTLAGGPDLDAESKCEEKEELKWQRMPGKIIEGMDRKTYYGRTLSWCKNACLLDEEFPCRTVEFNDNTKECKLSDKRQADDGINLIEHMEFSLYEWECRQITTTTKVTPRYEGNMITPTPYDPWDWAPEYWVLLGGGVIILALFTTAICSICVLTMKPMKNKKFLLEDTRA